MPAIQLVVSNRSFSSQRPPGALPLPSLPDSQLELLSQQLRVSADRLQQVAERLDEGWSVTFLARYRRQESGGLEERHFRRLYRAWREAGRKATVRSELEQLLESRGQLTSQLTEQLAEMDSLAQLSSLLSLQKRRKLPRAVVDEQLEWMPIACRVMASEIEQDELETELQRLSTASESSQSGREKLVQLLAELIADRPDIRKALIKQLQETSKLTCGPFVEPAHEHTTDQPATHPTAETMAAPADPESTESPPAESSPAESPQTESETPPPADDASETPTEPPPDQPVRVDRPRAATAASLLARPVDKTAERRHKRKRARRQKREQLESKFKHLIGLAIPLADVTTEQIVELDHGDRVRAITVDIEFEVEPLQAACAAALQLADHAHQPLLTEAVAQAVEHRLVDELKRELRRELNLRAAAELRGPLAHSLRSRAMRRPVSCRVLALHSKLRWGWQAVVLDERGRMVTEVAVPWNQGSDGDQQLVKQIGELADQHQVQLVALGDCPGARKLDRVFAAMDDETRPAYVLVAAAGIMEYVRTEPAARAFTHSDPHVRAAIAVGQRLQDPLFALLPVARKDLFTAQPELKSFIIIEDESLLDELDTCLCLVDVDVNTASLTALERLPGMTTELAEKVVALRADAPITSREQLKNVFDEDRHYEQAVAFLQVHGGDEPLDATAIHPDHYSWAEAALAQCQLTKEDLRQVVAERREALRSLAPRQPKDGVWMAGLQKVSLGPLAQQLDADAQQLKQVLIALRHAGNDIRRNSVGPLVRGRPKPLSELTPGTELAGSVLNVVDFGVFVDIGQSETGLVHISRLANGYIKNPRDFVWEGDPIRVWVISIDTEKNRLALTAIEPGSGQQRERSGGRRSASEQKPSGRSRPRDRSGNRPPHKARQGARTQRRKARSKVVKPITDGMKEGTEPMRAFSDLMQFYDDKDQPPAKKKPKPKSDDDES